VTVSTDEEAASLSRPDTKAGRLQRSVLALLRQHEATGELPTSNRFLFYELVSMGVLDKSKTRKGGRGADQDLSDASKRLRDEGLVPWGWIVDETRSLAEWEYAGSVADYVSRSVDYARIDCWAGEPPPIIVCESRTFGGVLRRGIAADYLCPVTATNGQVGGFLNTNVVPTLQGNNRRVLYIGDLDHQGTQIEENTRRVLVREAGAREWKRIALTQAQADEHALEPIAKLDKRYVPARSSWAIEVEALGQGVVTRLVRDALDQLLPQPLDQVLVREKAERVEIRQRLSPNGKQIGADDEQGRPSASSPSDAPQRDSPDPYPR
jgi:hypothetical protein